MLSWYLVYTKPKCEDRVAHKLLEGGLEVLNPKIEEKKFTRRKLRAVISPLFPCYVFVRFDLYISYRMVKYTRGVKSVVGTEPVPTMVPDEVIESIAARMGDDGVVRTPAVRFAHGDQVVIKAGPFEGIEAVFEDDLNGSERVYVLLKTINAKILIDQALLARAN